MGTNKQAKPVTAKIPNKGGTKKSVAPVKHASKATAPAVPKPTFNKNISDAQYLQFAQKRLAAADSIQKKQALYTYGHNYSTTETDCGHYTQATEHSLGDKGYPNYVPDQVNYIKTYGSWIPNIKNVKPGDFLFFSADSASKYNDKNPDQKYAHTALATGVDSAAGNIQLSNATLHRDKNKKYMPGTLQPGNLSMKTDKRTDPGWTSNNIFVGAGRMYPAAKTVQDSTAAPQPGWPGAISDTSQYTSPSIPLPFVKPQATGTSGNILSLPALPQGKSLAPYAPDFLNDGKQNVPDTKPNVPGTGNISHPSNSQAGKSGGGVSVNIQSTSSHSNSIRSGANNAAHNVHDEVVAILTSAVADSRIGIDIH